MSICYTDQTLARGKFSIGERAARSRPETTRWRTEEEQDNSWNYSKVKSKKLIILNAKIVQALWKYKAHVFTTACLVHNVFCIIGEVLLCYCVSEGSFTLVDLKNVVGSGMKGLRRILFVGEMESKQKGARQRRIQRGSFDAHLSKGLIITF